MPDDDGDEPPANGRSHANGYGHQDRRSSADSAVQPPLGQPDDEPTFAQVASTSVDTAKAAAKTAERRLNTTDGDSNYQNDMGEDHRGRGQGRARRYRIQKQDDLYQVNEFLKFLVMWPGAAVYSGWQLFVTLLCLVGAALLGPVMRLVTPAQRRPISTVNGGTR